MVYNVPDSIGRLKVDARGITAFADSFDPGDQPDAQAMLGSVTFTAQIGSRPIVAIAEDPKIFLALNTIVAGLDSQGRLRPPMDGKSSEIDEEGNLYLVAPDQPDALSVFGWTWTATFRPSGGQTWDGFSVTFRGEPNDQIDLVELYLTAQAASGGGFSPIIHKAPGPFDPETSPLPVGVKPGEYILDESTGNLYLVKGETEYELMVNLGGGDVESVNGKTGAVELDASDVGAAQTVHGHAIGDVTGLQGALDGKQPSGDYLTEGDLPDLSGYVETTDPRLTDARTPLAHTHSIGDVTGLQSALDSKAGTGDVFDGDYGSLDNVPTTFPPSSHTHTSSQISDASTVGRNVLTATNAANARSAIGAGTSNFSGNYNNLTNRPTIPSTASQVGAVAYEGSTPLKLWTGTQAQYDNISSPDSNTVYVVKE